MFDHLIPPDPIAELPDLVGRPGGEVEERGEERQVPFPAETVEGGQIEVGADIEVGVIHRPEEAIMLPPLPLLEVDVFHPLFFPRYNRVVLAEAGFGPADGGGDDLDVDELGVVLVREVAPDPGVELQQPLLLLRSPRGVDDPLDSQVVLLGVGKGDLDLVVFGEFLHLSALAVGRTPELQVVHHHKRHRADPRLAAHAGGQVADPAGFGDYLLGFFDAHWDLPGYQSSLHPDSYLDGCGT